MMPHTSPVSRYLLWLLLFGYFVLGVVTLTSGHGWGDDWAQYVLHAQNIVNGRAYGDTGYLFNPDNPSIGPPNYPPGLPYVLAPVIALFGFNILALKIACFACVVAALPLIFNLLSVSLGDLIALIAVGLFALHRDIWALRDYISSEAPTSPISLVFGRPFELGH
jgi:4-amino-4-deoxy-L-arabinose transferase-like glycosyltransferase